MKNEIENYNGKNFENIKHIDDKGNEFWEARELQEILGYKEWRYFSAVIEKAQVACSQSKFPFWCKHQNRKSWSYYKNNYRL